MVERRYIANLPSHPGPRICSRSLDVDQGSRQIEAGQHLFLSFHSSFVPFPSSKGLLRTPRLCYTVLRINICCMLGVRGSILLKTGPIRSSSRLVSPPSPSRVDEELISDHLPLTSSIALRLPHSPLVSSVLSGLVSLEEQLSRREKRERRSRRVSSTLRSTLIFSSSLFFLQSINSRAPSGAQR